MRRRARLDVNHAAIVKGLRRLGISVQSLAGVGGGAPDLLLWIPWQMRLALLEVKSQRARKVDGAFSLRDKVTLERQAEWRAKWGGPVLEADDLEGAIREIGEDPHANCINAFLVAAKIAPQQTWLERATAPEVVAARRTRRR